MKKDGVVIIYKVLVAYKFALKLRGKCLAGYKTELPACMYVYVFVCVLECVAVQISGMYIECAEVIQTTSMLVY